MEKTFKVTLIKSLIGTKQGHRACVRGLGLRHRNHTVTVRDTPENRGMITRARYLLKVNDAA
ncbi:MAG: 50S ribosomal protein L30 [Burkholderiales bacterium]